MILKRKTSGLIIIGNEILSGKTIDTNSNFISKELSKRGVDIKEILIIPDIEDIIIFKLKEFSKEFDYVSNVDERSFPDGLDVEIFTYSALEKSMKLANEPFHREHVTTYIRGISGYSKGEFKKFCLKNSEDLSHIRWTLDTKKDYYHIKKFFEELEDNFSWLDALKLENKINYTE